MSQSKTPMITVQGSSLNGAPISQEKKLQLENQIYRSWDKSAQVTREIEIRSANALYSPRVCN